MATAGGRTVTTLPSCNPEAKKDHHIGSPPTHFKNPWPSAVTLGFSKLFETRFLRKDKTNVPIPTDRKVLVPVREPDWASSSTTKLRATWLGHASFLVETPAVPGQNRGVHVLFDPVFSERTSPVQWFGPKRYNPPPCKIGELPKIDVIAISHNHYDHLDAWTIQEVWRLSKQKGLTPLIACALGNRSYFQSLLPDITIEDVIELDWWDGVKIDVAGVGNLDLICTPAQHTSARGISDKDKGLWCSWTLSTPMGHGSARKLFFAGDTGYRHVSSPNPTKEEEDSLSHCPAFKEIGELLGPIDLALLPIGLYSPRDCMSTVHCAPEDSACIHIDLKARKSIGMHYGTVRGGLSQYYEDVLEPPKRWREVCEKKGLVWNTDVGLCDIGETILV